MPLLQEALKRKRTFIALFTFSYTVWFSSGFQVWFSYDTTSPVPKQSCLKKLIIVPFVLMTNDLVIIACYLLLYGISSSFNLFSLFFSLKGSLNTTPKQT